MERDESCGVRQLNVAAENEIHAQVVRVGMLKGGTKHPVQWGSGQQDGTRVLVARSGGRTGDGPGEESAWQQEMLGRRLGEHTGEVWLC